MPQALIRNIDVEVMAKLRERAKKHGRSLQAELKIILDQAANEPERLPVEEFIREAARLRKNLAGKVLPDSARLIREDRGR